MSKCNYLENAYGELPLPDHLDISLKLNQTFQHSRVYALHNVLPIHSSPVTPYPPEPMLFQDTFSEDTTEKKRTKKLNSGSGSGRERKNCSKMRKEGTKTKHKKQTKNNKRNKLKSALKKISIKKLV